MSAITKNLHILHDGLRSVVSVPDQSMHCPVEQTPAKKNSTHDGMKCGSI